MGLDEALHAIATEYSRERSFERLQRSLPQEWIEQALRATGTATIRRRRLPAEQVIWLVLGMALYRDLPIDLIVTELQIALPAESGEVARSAIPAARVRVGPDPFQYLFSRSAEVWAHSSAALDRWRGLALYGLDATTLRVPDSDENRATFGNTKTWRGNGESGYPMVRLAALMALRSHLLAAARFDGCSVASEIALAKALWSEIPDRSLVLIDRGFFSADIFHEITSKKDQRHWMTRARKDNKWTVVKKLGASDSLVEMTVSGEARRKNPDLPRTMQVRAIKYRHRGYPAGVILTSLLDSKKYAAREIVGLYHERWETELGYDEIKTHLLLREESIRSKSPELVRQEIWGILLTYNLIRLEMERAADAAQVSPLRISFVNSMRVIQFAWRIAATMHSPGQTGNRLRALRDDLRHLILPPRRPERRFPRAVKIKMSNYPRKLRPPLPKRNRGKVALK